MVCVSVIHARTYIVCVGIADYPGAKNDLRVSANDAMTIQNIFDKNGHAITTSIINSRATIQNICNEMKAMFANATTNDNIILYFSGHGIYGGLCCYDGNISYQTLFGIMKQSVARNKMIMVDACYAGKMRSTNKRSDKYSNDNVMLFLSSRSSETSQETQFTNSLFTIYLERGLRGGADINRDKVITAHELYNFVHKGVSGVSKGKQHPVMWGKFNKNMAVIKW